MEANRKETPVPGNMQANYEVLASDYDTLYQDAASRYVNVVVCILLRRGKLGTPSTSPRGRTIRRRSNLGLSLC
jgi:hypothetical protein